jgi:hypothetical protein
VRISTTLLESFRRYQDGLLREDQLVARIRGLDAPTWRVLLGRAYDAVLQHPDRYAVAGGYYYNDPECARPFRFEEADVAPALALIPSHHDAERFQPKREREIAGHVVVAKADYLEGLHVDEFKTRVGDYDAVGYLDSMQWRFLLELFDADAVTYRVFRLADPSEGPPRFLSIETLPLYRYPALHDACVAHVEAFARWVYARGLWQELQGPRRRERLAPVTVPPRALPPPRAARVQPSQARLLLV